MKMVSCVGAGMIVPPCQGRGHDAAQAERYAPVCAAQVLDTALRDGTQAEIVREDSILK
ncbi:hypothetical protein [Chromobacterium phragmitis]|uniref:hypothetical protein n=1 Tax=Chromobacterium phragmitis TaxID=2202141 RepID=UPI00143DC005|nr:hypothetical protein [Chromobacterium phragmitis]